MRARSSRHPDREHTPSVNAHTAHTRDLSLPTGRPGHFDVRLTVPITFPEAVLGTEIEVPTPDGGRVRLKVPAGTPTGRTLRARGRGVVTAKKTGDLLVSLQIAVPQRVDGKAKEALEAFAEATSGESPRADLFAHVAENPPQ
jgi:molecular chaperone DnaJ